jgi:AraC family transcriptional regulator, ethanolamine operon transcriptional activator
MSAVTNFASPQFGARGDRRLAHELNWCRPAAPPFAEDCIARIDCADIDALTEQVAHWNVEVARLSSGAFTATGLMLPLNSFLISTCTINQPLLVRAAPPSGCFSIILSAPGSDAFLCRGRELAEGQCIVLSVGADAEAVSLGRFVGYAIAVSEDAWHANSEWAGDCSLAAEKGVQVRAPGAPWTAGVLEGMQWIIDALVRHPEGAMSKEVRASMADLLQFRLRARADTSAPPNDRREQGRRRIAVERARSFIHENLASPIRLSQLCAHAHLQARSLEYGFLQMVGMSPISYVRTMRLNRAHRLLRATDRSDRTITEIALDCGFWHLSQFAADYRKFFGESPRVAHRASSGASSVRHTAGPVFSNSL